MKIENLNRPILRCKEIESVTKNLPKQGEAQGYMALLENSFSNSSEKIEEQKTLSNSFYEARIALIPKPEKDTTEKKAIGQYP